MQKVRREVTSNLKVGKSLKKYDKFTYNCKDDDIWITTETPISRVKEQNQ